MSRSSLLLAAAAGLAGLSSAAIPDEDWGYVDVRAGAHMFWWLYGANNTTPRENQPLIMWLQGGPGASGTGYGNFEEMGPLDTNLNYRNTTWVTAANVIYVDNPVGAGFSYVDDASLYTTNNTQIAADLVTLMQAFLTKYPAFQTTPFFVFCESYGGKMTTGFALALLAAQQAGSINVNFRGIALGDSWISPIDFVDTWGPFLRATSLMDSNQLDIMNQQAVIPCDQAVAAGQWTQATNLWGSVENYVEQYACVDFYNILDVDCNAYDSVGSANSGVTIRGKSRYNLKRGMSQAALNLAPEGIDRSTLQQLYARHVSHYYGEDLDTLMNTQVRAKLGIIPTNVTWGGQSDAVFSALSADFMVPIWDGVDTLLAANKINVTVYEGQVDLICATVGAERWMSRLTWPGMPAFYNSTKTPMQAFSGAPTGSFTKSTPPLNMWWVMLAGHMVPADNGPMALTMVQTILAAQS